MTDVNDIDKDPEEPKAYEGPKVTDDPELLTMTMLLLLRQYMDYKTSMEDLVKAGSLQLAKLRGIMENKSLSMRQLPTEDYVLNALTKVVEGDGDADELRLEFARMTVPYQAGDSKNSREDYPQEDGLKRRKGEGNKGDEVKDSKPDNEQNKTGRDEQNESPKKKDEPNEQNESPKKEDEPDEQNESPKKKDEPDEQNESPKKEDEPDNEQNKTGKDEQNESPKKEDVMQDSRFLMLAADIMIFAQSSFNNALETAIDLAYIRKDMISIRRKMRSLSGA